MGLIADPVIQHRITGKFYRIVGIMAGTYLAIGQDSEGNFRGEKIKMGQFWFKIFYKRTALQAAVGGKITEKANDFDGIDKQ